MKYLLVNNDLSCLHFTSCIDYEFDRYVCDNEDCPEKYGDYCRCGHYENLQIKNVDLPYLLKSILKTSQKRKNVIDNDTSFVKYCCDRLIRIYEAFIPENWYLLTSKGYYGEEIDGAYFSNEKLFSSIKEMILLNDPNKRINYVLNQEYGYVLPILKNKIFRETTIDIHDVFVGNEYYLKKVPEKNYENLVDKEPIGVYTLHNGKYKIIDGYHRYIHALNNNFKKIKIIEAL